MRTKIALLSAIEKSRRWQLGIIILAALAIGTYMIISTVVISRDGVTFITFAKDMQTSFGESIKNNDQHPGYPYLILKTHPFFSAAGPFWSWIYAAQSVALAGRIIATVLIYFIGLRLVRPVYAFWGTLLLVFLPYPAQMGADTLSDWPHLMFFAAGFLSLLAALQMRKIWLFALAGILSGIGYLIRPESIQIVIYAMVTAAMLLARQSTVQDRARLVSAAVLLVIGFAVCVGPYMKFKGAVFPKKPLDINMQERAAGAVHGFKNVQTAAFAPDNIFKATAQFVTRLSENLVYFFVPFLVIGIWAEFRKGRGSVEKVLIECFMVLNIAILLWLYCRYSYMSRRHVLPFTALTIFFIPVGIEQTCRWLAGKNVKLGPVIIDSRKWLIIFVIIGTVLCGYRLLKPIGIDQSFIRQGASWLETNTRQSDTIAVSDLRMSFYAQRNGFKLEEDDPEKATYIMMTSGRYYGELPANAKRLCSISSGNGKTVEVYTKAAE